jgi:hypothetical protein
MKAIKKIESVDPPSFVTGQKAQGGLTEADFARVGMLACQ